MRKTHLKLVIWALLLALGMAGAWAAVSGAANLLAYFQQGAEPASTLNIVPNVPPDLHVALTWDADAPDTGRPIDPLTRSQIEAAYLRAWLQWNLSYVRGEPHGLGTYFTGPALAAVEEAVERGGRDGLRVDQADTAHRLQLRLYSADGAVAAFADRGATVAQVLRDSSGAILSADVSSADYDVVMLLEDGRWRVRHWVRRPTTVPPSPGAPACAGCVSVQGETLSLNGEPFQVAGINYYPQAAPWDTFWPRYNAGVIDRDLGRIKSLGLNTIRVFVPFEQFGGPRVEPAMLVRLTDLLDRAEAQGVKVIVTLFDFRGDYSLLRWAEADRHLEGLLRPLGAHPAVLAWDLKNEPDLDDDSAGAPLIDAWLRHTLRQARALAPGRPLTIGWSSPAAAARLADDVDIVSFHFYRPAAEFAPAYAALRAAAPGRPLLLGEFGLPTWNSIFPNGHSEAEQARYYADVLNELRASDAAGSLAWTLYDFASAPAIVAGPWPWQTGPQRHMGVLRADGAEKPAAALLAPGAALDTPPVPGWARWLKPFWLLVFGAGLAGLAVLAWLARRRG